MILLKGVPVKVLLVLQLCLNEFQMPVILVAAPQIFRDRKHFYHWGIADKLRKANSTSLREGLGFCRFWKAPPISDPQVVFELQPLVLQWKEWIALCIAVAFTACPRPVKGMCELHMWLIQEGRMAIQIRVSIGL